MNKRVSAALLVVLWLSNSAAAQKSVNDLPDPGAKSARGDYAAAIADYTKLIAMQPQPYDGYFTLRGVLRMLTGDLDGALADLNKSAEIPSGTFKVFTFTARGMLYEQRKQFDEALQDYERAKTLSPRQNALFDKRLEEVKQKKAATDRRKNSGPTVTSC